MEHGQPLDLRRWTHELAECVHLELLTWRSRLIVDSIRAFAIDCAPWEVEGLTLSFLTDQEAFDDSQCGKWSIGDWRLYDFTSGPNTHWPYGEKLAREAHERYAAAEKEDAVTGAETRLKARNQLVLCCAKALKSPQVASGLSHYRLANDFELFAGHPDEPGRNFCEDIA